MAVYTEVSDEELNRFVDEYDIGRVVSCKGIAEGVENSNYLLQTDQNSFILTLYEKRVRQEDLPFFVALMDHLAARGIDCPVPIHGKDGAALRHLAGRPAAIVSFLQGMWVRRPKTSHCAALGNALAKMHVAGEGFPQTRHNNLSVPGWRPLFEACQGRADEVLPGLSAEIETELDLLESDWPQDLPAGTIHADLFPDNVFFLDGKLSGFIDFYFACTDYLIYDLAVCLNAWCFEPDDSFNITKAQRLVQNYQTVRSLSQAEISALPILARGAALRFLLTRLYDWLNQVEGALVKPKDPREYHRKLAFHRQAKGPAAYGLN